MKSITLRTWKAIPIRMRDQDGMITEKTIELTTLQLIRQCIDNIPQGGIIASDMAKRIKVIDKIEKIKGSAKLIDLEDSEYLTLQECEAKITWSIINKCFIEFHDDIVNAGKK